MFQNYLSISENIKGEKYMLKFSDAVKYIEGLYNIKLIDYQKDCLKHIVAGDVLYTQGVLEEVYYTMDMLCIRKML